MNADRNEVGATAKDALSIGELNSRLASDTSTLVRQEMRLAKVELGQKAAEVGKAAALVAVGGFVAYAGLLAVIAALIILLAEYMAAWISALIVGAVILAAGYFLARQQLEALKRLDPTPKATIETLKEDKEWAKEQMR